MRRSWKRVLAALMVALMIMSIAPLSTFAAEVDVAETGFTDTTSNYGDVGLTVIADDQSSLAPGVTLNEVVAYDSNGDRVEMYVTTADTNVDTVNFYANYKDNQNQTYGLQTLSEQVAAMEANYEEPFKVVAGINASYYNISTGKPTGAFVMEGIDVTTESEGNAYAFFAVLKDGTCMIGNKGEYSQYKGQIKEAIGGYVHIVKDGAVVSGLDQKTKYPRQTIGMTADGKVILMTADGSQVPDTIGLTYQEQAEVMLAMGCVDALHLDGGNSATFGAVREGTEEFVLVNSPSGYVEREVSNTLCIVSTAVADGTFDHATISGDYDYFAPYSEYTFTAKGIDASGGPANEIPADVTWALSDASFGTINEGKFVSTGKTGEVDIQMVQGGKVVGSTTINVVNPTSIAFDSDQKTIPYGKSSALTVEAMYNLNNIYCTADAFDFVISNPAAGTMDGFNFTATTTESIASTTVTATYKYAEMDAVSVTLKFGKGSEVIYNFESGNVDEWIGVDKVNDWIEEENKKYDGTYKILLPKNTGNTPGSKSSSTFLATEENGGKVKNGNGSLGLTFERLYDKDTGGWSYNYMYYTGDTQIWRDVANGKNATKLGMWMYLPESAAGLYARICRTFTKDSTGKLYTNYDYLTVDGTKFSQFTKIPESGWVYAEFDLTAYDYQSSLQFNPDEDYAINNGKGADGNYYPAFLQFFVNTYDMEAENVTIYIDDITLDYSDVTDDRHAPTISDASVSANIDNFVAINGQTVANNYLSFKATVAENTSKANYTGLDYSTAKIYVDGKDMSDSVAFTAAGNTLALTDVYFADGEHEIVFEIADKQGNYSKLTKTLTVAGTAGNSVVSIVGYNNDNTTPKAGSLYYIDVKASDIAQIDSINTTLKMQTANTFELDHITAAEGVEFTYEFDELNNELTLDITNNSDLTGEAALVTIPVRVWAWSEEATGISAATQWATSNTPIVKVQVETVYGEVAFADGTLDSNYICGFYSDLDVATEVNDSTKWHDHTATAVADLAPTCTEAGYTGRTYCEGCASIVEWGTVVPATGHTYAIIDGVLKCEDCGITYTGEYEGKSYVDGILVEGWVENSYYVDGEKLTGVQLVAAPDGSGEFYYDFGDDGVSDKIKYSGLLYNEADGTYRCAKLGVVVNGWQFVEDSWYYFDKTTNLGVDGELTLGVITYSFTDGKLDSGVWAPTLYGMRYYYGPDYYSKGWQEIDGEKYFFENGYRLEGGWQMTIDIGGNRYWYYFDENGVYDETAVIEDGFYTDRNGYAYSKDGEGLEGLQLIDGTYYYFNYHGYAVSGTYAGRLFGEDYKAYTGILEKNGTLYYYNNGVTGTYGLAEFDGDYYYVYWGGVVKTGTHYVSASNCDLPAGEYTFGEDGKLVNGVYDIDGTLYFFQNGKTVLAGLYELDGDYYCVTWGGKVLTGTQYVGTTFCDLPAGQYEFGADGKMLQGVVDKDGTLYFYENGRTGTYGLYEYEGDYYYVYWGGVVKTGKQYVGTTYCDLPAGQYEFGADGNMLRGIVVKDGTMYYYENGRTGTYGLIELDGDYYYVYWGGVVMTGAQYVGTSYCDLPGGQYEFGADGKMLQGIVEKDGTLYYYDNGRTGTYGLIELDGDYYFVYWGGVVKTGVQYVSTSFCDLPAGQYEFGADGKMLDGIVEKDGTMYYYDNGRTGTYGLIELDGDYYYVYWGGVVKTGSQYVSTSFCDLPAGQYEFGADGKMLDGFVTIDGTIYYYVNGRTAAPGLIEVDGYYYFIEWGGKVITNRTYYVWETNGLTIPMNYKFDEYGRAVL